MELMNQPINGQLGDRLIEMLESSHYHTLNIVVAFAKTSGVLRIKDSLSKFREQGGKVNVCVGVDLGGTSYEAIKALLLNTDSLTVVHSETGQTFHPKIYQFLGEKDGFMAVGSHNLTGGGLWTNFESSIIITEIGSNDTEKETIRGFDTYTGALDLPADAVMRMNSQDDIDNLLNNGYIIKEANRQVRAVNATTKVKDGKRLFGNGVQAKIPSIAKRKDATPIPVGDEGDTVWFETKAMTGGSRNILDLSKKSLVERGDPRHTPFEHDEAGFMLGAVQFFGLNPADEKTTKEITLNFEGVDYKGNTILFPTGKNPNGTWRLQIHGVSASEKHITEAFRERAPQGRYYLVDKIIAFTKIRDDYYSMSVHPRSELEEFKTASHILGRNGSSRTARQLGLLAALEEA